MNKLKVHNQILQELILSSLYIRILSNYQTSIFLNQSGRAIELKVVSRNLLETSFRIGALSNKKENVVEFVQDDERQRRTLLKNYNSVEPKLNNLLIKQEVNNILKELEEIIKKKKLPKLTTRWYSEEANLLSLYQTYYAILCRTVHPCIGDIQKDFVFDNNHNKTSIKYGPNYDELEKISYANCSIMINSINHIVDIFQVDAKERLIELNQELTELIKKAI